MVDEEEEGTGEHWLRSTTTASWCNESDDEEEDDDDMFEMVGLLLLYATVTLAPADVCCGGCKCSCRCCSCDDGGWLMMFPWVGMTAIDMEDDPVAAAVATGSWRGVASTAAVTLSMHGE